MVMITEQEFAQLTNYIKTHYGIHMKEEKRTLLVGRLQQTMQRMNFSSYTEYLEYVKSDKSGKALTELANQVTTNHTFFMRETDHFDFYRDHVLPDLIARLREKDIRVWSAGCSSGQEPYTLAMIMADVLGKEKVWWDTKVLATDICSRVLEHAAKGEYPTDQIAALPDKWKSEYLRAKSKDTSVFSDKIRAEVIYRKFNLMDAKFPFKKPFHVIFCRNVMIYFDNPTREALVDKFWDHMEYGGYLFIGHSESLNRDKTRFRYVMPAVYRKE
jgi:chemotaxis protein methyltransferase CheR